MTTLVVGMGMIAVVLLVAALASGIVDRAPLSYPIIFLGLGFLLGGGGLGVVTLDARSPLLEIVGTVSLALVLFLDAVNIQIEELRREWYVPFLTLGPGALLVIGGVALAALLLVGTTPLQSLLLGATLASTDPVVLRDVVRDERIPRSVRRALSVEAGMNDVVVLPVFLIFVALLTNQAGDAMSWAGFLARVLIFSPLIGLAVGGVGARLMYEADRRFEIRKEYQAMYGIGLVLAAYVAGAALDGNGFLAAFFAGLAITLFNTSLCSCFLEYGQVTAEMMMLLAFVLFGAVLSELLGMIDLLPPLLLGVMAIAVIRPAAFALILSRANMSGLARGFIGWFGPRGLSALLFAMVALQAGVPEGERLLAITGAVVVVSVIAHGISATPVSNWYGQRVAASMVTLQEEREGTFTGLFSDAPERIPFMTPAELYERLKDPIPPLVLDVRARAHYDAHKGQLPGSVRVLPDLIGDWAAAHTTHQPIVAYCACPNDATSIRVVSLLRERGQEAYVLQGGYDAWRSQYPLEPKPTNVTLLEVS
ncbi:MAG: cation:proton antiporter [Anaerolineae bacterium]